MPENIAAQFNDGKFCTDGGWEQVGGDGQFKRADNPDPSLNRESAARDRGVERDRASGGGFERSTPRGSSSGSTRSFDRGSYGGGFRGGGGGRRG